MNESMLVDPNFHPSSEESEDESAVEINNSIQSARRGLGSASIIDSSRDLLHLIEFTGKIKQKMKSMMQTSTEEHLRLLAQADAVSKGRPLRQDCVSFSISGGRVAGTESSEMKDSKQKEGKNINYAKLKERFPRISDAREF